MEKSVAQAIADIRANIYAGAVELADHSADVLVRMARTATGETPDGFRQNLLSAGRALIEAQPAMAPLVNLVNAALWQVEPCTSLEEMRLALDEVARDFKRQLRLHEASIAEQMLPFIPEGACVLTNSRSTTVRAALLHARRAGRRFEVLCAEGRPGYEGRTMAAELAAQGIAVTLVVDALALSRVPHTQVVLIGADHLSSSGLVNKIGTYALALTARYNHVPMYTLCSSHKFLPPGYIPPHQSNRPPDQVWHAPPAGVRIENYYFDRTPLNNVTGIVTERGVLPAEVIEGWLASVQLHPALHFSHARFTTRSPRRP